MYPLVIISKVVKIQNHSRLKTDFIAAGLGTLLYLNIKTRAVNFRFPFPKVGSFHIFGLKVIRFILLITKNDNLYKKCIFFKTSHFPEVESFNLK